MATFYFLELKNHYPDFKLFQPLLLYEVNDLPMEATSLDYTEEGNLLFVGLSKRKESNSLINKVRYKILYSCITCLFKLFYF